MGEIVYNKLVRDNIPLIVSADGQTPITRVLGDDEYLRALLDKLVEEAIELREQIDIMGERADVAEVLLAIDGALGLQPDLIEAERIEKAKRRGGFEQRIFLEKVITND